jgi:hypothetical protein
LAALIFISSDDFFLFYLLAGAGIVRAERDPRCGSGLASLFLLVA